MAWRVEELPLLDRYGTHERKLADIRPAVFESRFTPLLCGNVLLRAVPSSLRENSRYRSLSRSQFAMGQ